MSRFFPISLFLSVLGLAWWAYHPGLSGDFLFDDFNNLHQLGDYGPVDNLRTLLLYLSSGSADPLGRPLSMLSFLIDANDWPADPEPFKRTAILLHLLNGVLLSWLLLSLGRRLGIADARAQTAAILGAGLWVLHPLLVSTTLYVVQREAMLPTTFSLIGMLLWLHGRARCLERRRFGLLLMISGAWGCTALAMLCKANGILLPLLLLVTEWTLPDHRRSAPSIDPTQEARLRRARLWLLGAPSAALAAWLLSNLPRAFTSAEVHLRPWTLAQRLATEPRVLCDYLQLLWIPRSNASSLFNDGYRASTDLLHPWTTLPAIIAIGAVLTLGFVSRRRHPALSFAILFYFAGQLLESTVVPLELYFEHRNYLPALPMFWPLALWLTGDRGLQLVRLTLALVLPAVLTALCHARAGIWGKPEQQALLLAQVDPTSPRAQAYAAAYDTAHGRPDLAIARLNVAITTMPTEPQIALNLINAECAAGGVRAATVNAANYALVHSRTEAPLVHNWLINAISAAGRCPGLDLSTVKTMIEASRQNPHFAASPGHLSGIQELYGRMALARGDGAAALRDFNASLSAFPAPDGALLHAALLGSAGFSALGLQHLEYYKTLPAADRHASGMLAVHLWLLDRDGYLDREFARMQSLLRADAASPDRSAAQSATPQ